MINSLFLLGGSYNKDRKLSIAFIIGWIVYMFTKYDFSFGIIFPIINMSVIILISVTIGLIKNRKINTILSIFSILIWSIVIDIICFFMYPVMTSNQSLIAYIIQGILFNYKYVFVNAITVCFINVIIVIKENVISKMKKYIYGT